MGDMGELADDAAHYHREVGVYAKQAGVDMLYCCGSMSRIAAESFGAGGYWFDNKARYYLGINSALAWLIYSAC